MPQDRTRKIVITGVLGALVIFLSMTPFGLIAWNPAISATTIHIPVIIGAILEGPIVGLLIGLIFGVSTLIRAAVAPIGALDPAFTNPLISVLPRLFIGPVACLVWTALKRWKAIGVIGAALAGSLTNTVLVLGMIGLVPSALGILRGLLQQPNSPAIPLLWGIVISNGVPEAITAAILCLIILFVFWRIPLGRRKGANL